MRCSNCGKDIPVLGKVCPWCHADKLGDQALTVFSGAGAIGGAILGLAAFGFWGAVGGFVVGAIGGASGAAVAMAKKKEREAKDRDGH